MSKSKSGRVCFLTVITFALLVSGVVGSQATTVGSQKILKQPDTTPNDPVKIVAITVENREVRLDEAFNAGDQWLRGAVVKLRNVSKHDVIYLSLGFFFPETLASGNEMLFTTELGNMPGIPVANGPLLLQPNQEASIVLNDEEYKGLVKFLGNRHKVSDLNKVNLSVRFAVFSDLTAWGTGLRFKQDPANPRSWIPFNE